MEKMSPARQKTYKEIEEIFGTVPTFLKQLPDNTIELEWGLMKKLQIEPTQIPNKYKNLIGLGISAATRCRYCTLFHTEAAKLNGATDAEIQDAMQFSKEIMGWSTYVNGMQIDYNQFRTEIAQMMRHAREMMDKGKVEGKRAAASET